MHLALEHLFGPHVVDSYQKDQQILVEQAALVFARLLDEKLPEGELKKSVILKLREVTLLALDTMANAGKLDWGTILMEHYRDVFCQLEMKDYLVSRVTMSSANFAELLEYGREAEFEPETRAVEIKKGLYGKLFERVEVYVKKDQPDGVYLLHAEVTDSDVNPIQTHMTVEKRSPLAHLRQVRKSFEADKP